MSRISGIRIDVSSRFKKRGKIDVIADILTEAVRDTKKTPIMYECNLSHRQLQVYLELLLETGLLASHSNEGSTKKRFLRITSKGSKFLSAYHELKASMS